MHNPAQPDWSSKTYLVIDDFSIVHRMMRDMLRKLGALAIDSVKNGADAIALLQEKQYDVVLCDYNFSEGPNGQQILEEARHRDLVGLTCIWIMVSSEKAVETVMGAAEQAPDGYILKPLTESLLLARLNRAWDRKQAFAAIERAYAAHDYLKAAALCDQRLASAPMHAMDLLRMKASLLLKAGQLQPARQVYEQALALRDQVWAKAGLARIDSLEGRHDDARRRLQDIVREHPSFLDAYDQLAQALQRLGETSQALAVLEQAARLSPYSVLRQKNLGDVALQLGRFEVAEQAYQTSIAVGEYSILKSPEAYLGLVQLYGQTGRREDEQALLTTIRKNFPHEDARLEMDSGKSQVHAETGQPAQASMDGQASRRQPKETACRPEPPPRQEVAPRPAALASHATPPPAARPAPAAIQPAPAKAQAAPAETQAAPPAAQPAPPAASALHQRAQVLLQYMSANGYNIVSAEEVRAVLARAEKLSPGHPRASELAALLQALAAGHG